MIRCNENKSVWRSFYILTNTIERSSSKNVEKVSIHRVLAWLEDEFFTNPKT